MNLCAVLINCDDYTSQLSLLFTPDDSVLDADIDNLIEVYKISPEEIDNMSVDEIIIDRITKLSVDY
jgi:KEOPS complex subunit Cgi121